MTDDNRPEHARAPDQPGDSPVMTSSDLLRGNREVTILHGGEAYRLRVTSKDRLILTK